MFYALEPWVGHYGGHGATAATMVHLISKRESDRGCVLCVLCYVE